MHKLAVNPSSYILYKLFVSVWTTGKVPNTWKEGIIVSLCKGKGQRNERSVYRPISILPVPRIFFRRIEPVFRCKRRPEQYGFTSGRSITDAILALRLLSEVHRALSRPLHAAFIDLKAAYDFVDRLALWGIGLRQYLLRLIEDLFTGSTCKVHCLPALLLPQAPDRATFLHQRCDVSP